MGEISWIRLDVGIFDNRKIKVIRRCPEGNNILLIWIALLTMAGRANDNGLIYITPTFPYTAKTLADELDFEESTVTMALQLLERLDMIHSEDGNICISDWENHQNIEGMKKTKEAARLATARWREKKKLVVSEEPQKESLKSACDITVISPTYHGDDAEKIREDKIREEKRREEDTPPPPSYSEIVSLFNSTCKSYPKVKSLSDARKKALSARLKQYTFDDFQMLFQKAEASPFLKGRNKNNWSATFDWLIADTNMAKVLDGNYDDRKQPSPQSHFLDNAIDLNEWFGED